MNSNKVNQETVEPEEKDGKNYSKETPRFSPKDLNKEYRKKLGVSGAENFKLGITFHGASLANWKASTEHQNKVNEWKKKKENFLVFLGSPGVGKTHLAVSLLNLAWEEGEEIRFVRSNGFFEKLHQAISRGWDQFGALLPFIEVEYLIFDDLGTGKNNEWEEQMLFEVIDRRHDSKKPTVFTSNFNPDQLKMKLGNRIFDRLMATKNTFMWKWDVSDRSGHTYQ